MKQKIVICGVAVLLTGCSIPTGNLTSEDEANYSETQASYITFSETTSISGNGLSLKDDQVTIASPGTYIVEGTSENGKIIVNCNGDVKLVLRGVNLSSTSGPIIKVAEADMTYIIADEDTVSTLSVSGSDSEEETAAIMSHDDMKMTGSGTIDITAEQDGIHANDTFSASGVSLNIEAGDDGIQVNDRIEIDNSSIQITSGSGAGEVQQTSEPAGEEMKRGEGEQPPQMPQNGENSLPENNENGMTFHPENRQFDKNQQKADDSSEDTETKSKGIVCEGSIAISNSTITLNTQDDGIHADENIDLNENTMQIAAGDDGIHADDVLTINSDIMVSQSYEGLEAKEIIINDGNINITSSDDGINSADPSVSDSMQADDSMLTINGGDVTINANGDGIDMNGNGEMNGGNVIVYGPINGGDGALDYAGTFNVNGGTLVAGGSSGMSVMPSETSMLNSVMLDASGKTELKDNDGNVLFTYESEKEYSNLVISSEKLETGNTYTVWKDGEETDSFTILQAQTNLSTKVQTQQRNQRKEL